MRFNALMASLCLIFFLLLSIKGGYGQTTLDSALQGSELVLEKKQYSLTELIGQIERQTFLRFVYNPGAIKGVPLDFPEKRYPIKVVLDEVQQKGIAFKRTKNTVYMRVKEQLSSTIDINGKVWDAEFDEPLAGATVRVTNSAIGVITDGDGEFHFPLPDSLIGQELNFSYVGYKEQTRKVIPNHVYEVFLEPKVEDLDEVVVVGYGSQVKSDLTGAVAKVDGELIRSNPQASPVQAIQGRVAGVDVVSQSFAAGQESTVRIRGERSILASNDPLIVLDGIPFEGTLNDINSNEVSSVEILKDASSTAIYGSRAANGVIIITTKRSNTSGLSIDLSTYYGVTSAANKVDMMSSEEFIQFRREAERTRFRLDELPSIEDSFAPFELERIEKGESTDWQDQIYDQGTIQNINVSVGGTIDDKKQYFFSAGYFKEDYPIENVDFTRYNVRINFDSNPSEGLEFGTSTFISQSKGNSGGFGGTDGLDQVYRTDPLSLVRDENGDLLFQTSEDPLRFNPLFNTLKENSVDEDLRTRIFPTFYFQLELNDNLYYKANLGGDIRLRTQNEFRGQYATSQKGEVNYVEITKRESLGYTFENILQYDQTFNDHSLSSTMLFSLQEKQQIVSVMRANQLNQAPEVTFFGIGDAAQIPVVSNTKVASQLVSSMLRLNYKYKGKYLATLTGRADGSSILADGNKWAFFPSMAVAWNVHSEPFFQSQRIVSDLKIRASYGITGNQAIDPYDSQAGLKGTDYYFGDEDGSGFESSSIANMDLDWERTKQFDIGVDVSFLNGRLRTTLDYYSAKTTDLLFERRIPLITGFESIVTNIGSTQNKGIEVTIGADLLDGQDFEWVMDLNFAKNTNRILDLFGDTSIDDIGNNLFIGSPVRVFYDNVFNGIWQLNEEELANEYGADPGDIKLVDLNNDGVINDNDRQVLGSQLPSWTGGLYSKWSFKGVDLSVSISTRQGFLAKNEFKDRYNTLRSRDGNVAINYWTPENASNVAPRPNSDDQPDNLRVLSIEDGSFVRVRNITLGYTFPRRVSRKLFLNHVRVYVMAQNPFLFTDFEGLDPEQPTFSGDTKFAQAANTKQFITGLSIKF
ncbi:SusC/RagA family TonB-linked outer membrane protein [Roseivirga pacifica]|uniref:SusC/RagA family TonB-linked outer membrane protein n=1 Tax=Roseivirga pacifica TaxID=1267423 RepID=UPI003BB1BBDA